MYCQQCGRQLPDDGTSCPDCQQSTVADDLACYQALIGEKNQHYYLRHFAYFDARGKTGTSWHWPACFATLGWLLYRKGDQGGALDVLQKALAIRADPEIAAHCGEVLWVLGRRDEAEKTWNDAAKASPDNAALAASIKRFKP